MREAQRKPAAATSTNGAPASISEDVNTNMRSPPRVDLTAAQASVQAAGQKAGAYISSWGAWASERRKGWAEGKASPSTNVSATSVRASSENAGGEKSPGKLARWSSNASGKMSGGAKMKEEKGGDGIGRLDA